MSSKTYYLTVEHSWVTDKGIPFSTEKEYVTHFEAARSFGPYTLKGASRIEKKIHAILPNIRYHQHLPLSGQQFTAYRIEDAYLGVTTRITSNHSPYPVSKRTSPLNYV